MDWLRKLLGFQDRPREDGNPFTSPTWDEIMSTRENTQNPKDFHHDMQDPLEHFFHGRFPNNNMFSPHQELFEHIDNMFSHLDDMMKDMHRHPAWTIPGSLEEPEPQTPRDHMLKVPDTNPDTVPPNPPYPPHNGREGDQWSFQSGEEDFNQHLSPFIFDPHGLFDRIFENFGMHPHEMPFSGHIPEIGPGTEFEDHSRESLIKKRDSDIDDRVSDDLSKLPKGGPGYSHDSSQTVDPRWSPSPWSHPESSVSPHTGINQKFYSQSIVTIRKPDGSIEETKKYTDSTGREEVTVTHKQPEEGSTNLTPLHPGGLPDQTPSIFSWFFTR